MNYVPANAVSVGLLNSLSGAVATRSAELTTLLKFDPAIIQAYHLDNVPKTVGSAFRLAAVCIGGSIFVFLFAFFFIVLPIAFFFEVVLKGELQLGEIKDTVMVHIVDSFPTLPTLPAMPGMPPLPAFPAMPNMPALHVPAMPTLLAFPGLPAFPFSSSPPPTQDTDVDGASQESVDDEPSQRKSVHNFKHA